VSNSPAGRAANPALWDERFRPAELPYGEQPSLFLVEQLPRLGPPGRALLPGDGGGRNGVWLAGQGWQATSLDFSPVALARARELAGRQRVQLDTVQADVTTWSWPRGELDLVVAVYLHMPSFIRPAVHRAMLEAVKPGGYVLIEAFAAEQLAYASGGPKDPDLLYREEALRSDFGDAEILVLRTERIELDEGPLHRGPGILVRLLARRRTE
jgi:SAM-dependent methyltransferase